MHPCPSCRVLTPCLRDAVFPDCLRLAVVYHTRTYLSTLAQDQYEGVLTEEEEDDDGDGEHPNEDAAPGRLLEEGGGSDSQEDDDDHDGVTEEDEGGSDDGEDSYDDDGKKEACVELSRTSLSFRRFRPARVSRLRGSRVVVVGDPSGIVFPSGPMHGI